MELSDLSSPLSRCGNIMGSNHRRCLVVVDLPRFCAQTRLYLVGVLGCQSSKFHCNLPRSLPHKFELASHRVPCLTTAVHWSN